MFPRLRWIRIVLGALGVEVVLLAVAAPLNQSARGRDVLLWLVVPLCVAGSALGGWWVARAATVRPVLHGLLLGALAAVIYALLTYNVTLPAAYLAANVLKLPGGALGGWLARSRIRKATPGRAP